MPLFPTSLALFPVSAVSCFQPGSTELGGQRACVFTADAWPTGVCLLGCLEHPSRRVRLAFAAGLLFQRQSVFVHWRLLPSAVSIYEAIVSEWAFAGMQTLHELLGCSRLSARLWMGGSPALRLVWGLGALAHPRIGGQPTGDQCSDSAARVTLDVGRHPG